MSRWATRGAGIAIGIVLIAAGSGTRGLGVLVLAGTAVAAIAFEMARRSGSVGPHEFDGTYNANADEVFEALRSVVVQLGYRVTSSDARQREIAFNTGMSWKTWAGQDFSGLVEVQSRGRGEVRLVGVTSQRGAGSIQSISWGETEKLGNRVLERLAERLDQSNDTVAE